MAYICVLLGYGWNTRGPDPDFTVEATKGEDIIESKPR